MNKMKDLGEKGFISGLLPNLFVHPSFVNGFGDDASIVDVGLDKLIACKIDRAPAPVSVKLGVGDFRVWGRLAAVANISDLLASGADPKAMMLSLVLPDSFSVNDAENIVLGCQEACLSNGVAFIGGDTKEGATAQVVGSAWGTVDKEAVIGRGVAKNGDALFIAGNLGAFAASLALLLKKKYTQESYEKYVNILNFPTLSVNESRFIQETGLVKYACDLSDGLFDAINIFCGESLGIEIKESSLPMHDIARNASHSLGVPLWRFALGVGDWPIAFVVEKESVDCFLEKIPSNMSISLIGEFNESFQKTILDINGEEKSFPSLINEHFRKRAEDIEDYLDELLYKN
tara:strand:- start:240 stop:1277 length:1038 start_codon:yes stop_codon:yes gene_type:complete